MVQGEGVSIYLQKSCWPRAIGGKETEWPYNPRVKDLFED